MTLNTRVTQCESVKGGKLQLQLKWWSRKPYTLDRLLLAEVEEGEETPC